MKRINPWLFLLLFNSVQLSGQSLELGFGTGSGSYAMSELKIMNSNILEYSPFEAKLVEDFPPFFYYRPYMLVKGKYLGIGLQYSYESTGSRISSIDYSAEYRFDMVIHSNSPGLYATFGLPLFKNLSVGAYSAIGLIYSTLSIHEYLSAEDEPIFDNKYKFKAKNTSIEGGLELRYKIACLGIKLNGGYLYHDQRGHFYQNLDPSTNPNINLLQSHPNWNGYRFGISIFYTFVFKSWKERIRQRE